MGHVVVGVAEIDAQLFSLQCEPAIFQTKLLHTLYYVTTTAL